MREKSLCRFLPYSISIFFFPFCQPEGRRLSDDVESIALCMYFVEYHLNFYFLVFWKKNKIKNENVKNGVVKMNLTSGIWKKGSLYFFIFFSSSSLSSRVDFFFIFSDLQLLHYTSYVICSFQVNIFFFISSVCEV